MDFQYQLSWHQLAHRLIDELVHNPGMTLSGIQTMRGQYKVSRLTVERAFNYLENLEILEPAQVGKKREIDLVKLQKVVAQQGRSDNPIFFVSDSPSKNLPYMARDIFETFHVLCEREHFSLNYVEVPQNTADLRTLLISLQPRGIILYTVPETIANVVLSLNIPAIGIGTICPRIPTFNTRYATLLCMAFEQACATGHRRITAPIWKVRPGIYEKLYPLLEEKFSISPIFFSKRYNLPLVDGKTKADYHVTLHKLFHYTPPTCIILSEISQFLTASTFFMEKGLRIPEDISIIFLSNDPLLEDLIPSMAHFSLYSDEMTQRAFLILLEKIRGLQSHKQIDLIPTWIPGDSLTAPKDP